MNQIKELYNKRLLLEEKKQQLEKKLRKVDKEMQRLQKECNHETVFQMTDNSPHKIGEVHTLYCPVCKKIEKIYSSKELDKTVFAFSAIINVGIMNHKHFKEVIEAIDHETENNLKEEQSQEKKKLKVKKTS